MGDTVSEASAGWFVGMVMVAGSGAVAASLGVVATAGLALLGLG